jgi:hypothetical protein
VHVASLEFAVTRIFKTTENRKMKLVDGTIAFDANLHGKTAIATLAGWR